MKTSFKAFGFLLCCFLVACSALEVPQGVDQQLAYAYKMDTAILTAAANAVEAGTLTVDEGAHLLQVEAGAKQFLDSARVAFSGGDLATAEGQLALAINVLTELRDYLNSRVKP